MKNKEFASRYKQLNAEMLEQHQIASDSENQDSDVVIRARKEVERIQHDIAYLLDPAHA